jgi:hypothetical protein
VRCSPGCAAAEKNGNDNTAAPSIVNLVCMDSSENENEGYPAARQSPGAQQAPGQQQY